MMLEIPIRLTDAFAALSKSPALSIRMHHALDMHCLCMLRSICTALPTDSPLDRPFRLVVSSRRLFKEEQVIFQVVPSRTRLL